MARLHQARLPSSGECYLDQRGSDRALVVRRQEAGEDGDPVVVLALWRGAECVGTFRLRREDVAPLATALGTGPTAASATR